jgi:hypothetical protein
MIGSKRRSGIVEREDGGKQAVGRGGECPDGAVIVDHAASERRTRGSSDSATR